MADTPRPRTRAPLVVKGARTHNLKNIDVTLPHGKLIIITGVSGSGKSSLAFDTIYAEGQRRYVESLSAYARQFLERMEKPDVDRIEGICPAIAIRQKNSVRNPRSTVGTTTEIHDYMRLLFARVGRTFCRQCGAGGHPRNGRGRGRAGLVSWPERRLLIGFEIPVVADARRGFDSSMADEGEAVDEAERRGSGRTFDPAAETLETLRRRGFGRLLIVEVRLSRTLRTGRAVVFDEVDSAALKSRTRLEVVVDRLRIEGDLRSRLTDSIETSYREGGGAAFARERRHGRALRLLGALRMPDVRHRLRDAAAAPVLVQQPVRRLSDVPRLRQHHRARHGARRARPVEVDQRGRDRAVEQAALSGAARRAEACGAQGRHPARRAVGRPDGRRAPLRRRGRLATTTASADSSAGSSGRNTRSTSASSSAATAATSPVPIAAARGCAAKRATCASAAARSTWSRRSTVRQAQQFFAELTLTEKETAVADKVLREIERRLSFLSDVGLDYLTLDRLSSTLSGGESQRINLATSLGSALVGTLYVLDEPSIGLHSRDNQRLIDILQKLRQQGNTVLVVEHDEDMIRVADHIVDIGLGAGEQGGRVVYSGDLPGLLLETRSLTAKYLRHELAIPVPSPRRRGLTQKLKLKGATEHNLKDVDIDIPLNTLTCVTGVSGSGKSTLVHDVLYAAIKRAKGDWDRRVGTFRGLDGLEYISDVVLVDQTPIGRTPRSNPVTYLKAFDPIRELFSLTRDAKARGLTASHFSFNVPGGRCEACQGEGEVRVEMQFLADVFVPCDQCDGMRFKPQVLEVRYKGKNVHQVLEMTVREALAFFSTSPKVLRRLQVLDEIGLGYLRLGQPATTLSGGEAQRIKIAAHLASVGGERLLYILDEPTTGLHFDDIAKLLTAFRKLVEAGHTLLVIEHNLDVIKTADYVIDLGPEGGEGGGEVIATGTPEQVAQVEASHTGRALRQVLAAGRSNAYAAR